MSVVDIWNKYFKTVEMWKKFFSWRLIVMKSW